MRLPCFYDISLLDSDYFTSPLTLLGTLVKLQFSSSDIEVKDTDNNVLFKVVDNEVTQLAENCSFSRFYNGLDSTSEVLTGILEFNTQNFEYTSNSGEILVLTEENVVSLSNDNVA